MAPDPTASGEPKPTFVGSRFTSPFTVRPDDIDLFQHVHSSRYQNYLLAARFDQMERCYGISMQEFMTKGFGWFVSDFRIQYKAQLGLGDEFQVTTWIQSIRAATVTVEFEIQRTNPKAQLCCLGESQYVFINLANGRPTRIPDWVVNPYSI
jgi:YbgC/YbaW family acyl-CoA thioester hydrolase